ncbi:MAG: VTT domain-containing protein [Planctomycetota bacterium]
MSRLTGLARELGAVGPLAVFAVAGPLAGAALLVASSERWYPYLEGGGLAALAWLLGGTVVLAGLSLVPTHATSLLAGMLFGGVAGSAVAMLGIAGAASLGYGVLRRLVGDAAILALARRPKADAVHRALVRRRGHHVAGLLALIRLSPVMPFAGTNLLMAASGVGFGAFLGGTLLGIAPRVVAVAVAGAGLEELDLSKGPDRRLALLGLIATAIVLVVLGRVAGRALRRATDVANSAESGTDR